MNELKVMGHPCLRKTLQVPRRKSKAKSCFEVQKRDFGKSGLRFFVITLSQMELSNVDTWKMYGFV